MSFFANTASQAPEPKKLANIRDDAINSNQQAVPVKHLARIQSARDPDHFTDRQGPE